MKLEKLKSVEINAIEKPAQIAVPPFADQSKLRDRIFGALCRINPELPCMEDETFLKRVFVCIKAANNDKDEMMYQPQQGVSYVKYMKENSVVQKWRKWYSDEKERKAEYRKAHKDELKKESDERKAKYGVCKVNGEEDTLATGWALESEGIFFGRGDSPANGYWKVATQPEDVTVNTNGKKPILIENQLDGSHIEKSFNWNVQWDPDFHGAAKYKINIGVPNANGKLTKVKKSSMKILMFSSVKKEGQEKKYNAGATLGVAYEKIITKVTKDLSTLNIDKAGTAIAVFFLFEKGIRIGNKEATENGTKGLLSLVWGKDVKRKNNKIKFDFYGKDSVRDTSEIETEFAEKIEKHWLKFNQLNTSKNAIKEYIAQIVPELDGVFTPKLARTAVAAYTAQKALDEVTAELKVTKDSPLALKKLAIDEATMRVAKRLNHQRGVNKAAEEKRKAKFAESEVKLDERKAKVREQIAKKTAKIEELKKKGDKEKIKTLKEQIKTAKAKLETAEMSLEAKSRNANFVSTTAKNSYIDPEIIIRFCEKIKLPIEKVYSKAQLKNFDFAL